MRFLLIESDPTNAERITTALTHAKHTVMPASGFGEASEALEVQKFDAVLLPYSRLRNGFDEFTLNLRRLERSQRNTCRTCILSFAQAPVPAGEYASHGLDGFITEEVGSERFAQAAASLASSIVLQPQETEIPEASTFDSKRFLAQVAGDRALALEVIDLFLLERGRQMADVRYAVKVTDSDLLARAAHTIKGSLGSVAAERARLRAQELETAAKKRDFAVCRASAAELEGELKILEQEFLHFRSQ